MAPGTPAGCFLDSLNNLSALYFSDLSALYSRSDRFASYNLLIFWSLINGSRVLWFLKRVLLVFGFGVLFWLFEIVILHTDEHRLNTALTPHPAPAAQALKLLSEDRLRKLFTYDGIWLFPKNECDCTTGHQGGYNFENAYGKSDLPAVRARREAEYEHFQRREGLPHPPPLLAQPNLPFGYPVQGVEVMPLHTVPIPGLRFEGPEAPFYEVTLTASLGTLNTLADTPDHVVQGRGQKQLVIATMSRKLLNFILRHVTYTSTVYQPHRVDIVSLESKSSVAKFPVTIRYPVIPKLYDPGPERKLRDLVTIATKTFLRPHKLLLLLQSIRQYYPDLTVIVADDSGKPLKINDSHVEYYTMPFGKRAPRPRAPAHVPAGRLRKRRGEVTPQAGNVWDARDAEARGPLLPPTGLASVPGPRTQPGQPGAGPLSKRCSSRSAP
ncbi:beta-1,4 N-acetylgalactosaminyltransferase 2 [Echinops telfairi]|uniref:Beta-1,4 N-acetylgalactosaminyltransferase 2 n=1 Tax=Echinops telfairi TaxID=9371 RepID=A0AC55DU24_ECHTE|nr:beta-1,4 N-acetylgalactosaminyltransferase 2 [Echinops telfairi]